MKIAVLHSFLDQLGGAEKVALTLAKELKADLITTNFNQKDISNFGFESINIKSLGNVSKKWPKRQQQALNLFKKNKFNNYDLLIITSEWSISSVNKKQPVIWYVNSVPEISNNYSEKLLKEINKYTNKINFIIANSNKTQRQITRYFKKDSILIYPPVEIDKFQFKKFGDYWLSVNRLDYYKRIDLQIKTFSEIPNEKLMIVGSPKSDINTMNYFSKIKQLSPKNITFLGEKNGKELINLYANCKGFIATAKNEFFGITPVEAMASGKPVVAVNEGGYKETVDIKTGILTDPTSHSLAKAIKEVSLNLENYKENCIDKSRNFSKEKFMEHMNKIIKKF